MFSSSLGPLVIRWVFLILSLLPFYATADDAKLLKEYQALYADAFEKAAKSLQKKNIPISSVELKSTRILGATLVGLVEATSDQLGFKAPGYVTLEVGKVPLSEREFSKILEDKLDEVVYRGLRSLKVSSAAPVKEKYAALSDAVDTRIKELKGHRTGLINKTRTEGSYLKKMALEQEKILRSLFKELGKIEYIENNGSRYSLNIDFQANESITETELQTRRLFLQEAKEVYRDEIHRLMTSPGRPRGGVEAKELRIKNARMELAKCVHALRILDAYSRYLPEAETREMKILEIHLESLMDLKVALKNVCEAFAAGKDAPDLEKKQSEAVAQLEKLVDHGLSIKGYVPVSRPMQELKQLSEILERFDKTKSIPHPKEVVSLHDRSLAVSMHITAQVKGLNLELETLQGKNLTERKRIAAITSELNGLSEMAIKLETLEKSFRILRAK